ncbi:MAG: signal peptide peptidase SppA [Bacteroidia bacterium]
MKTFFKIVFGSMLGFFLSIFLLVIILIAVASASGGDKEVKLEKNTVVLLKLNSPVKDRTDKNPFDNFSFGGLEKSSAGLNDILENIDKAAAHPDVAGIFLDISVIPAGMATIEEIRNALLDFKKSGKFIYAYSEAMSQPAYYLATAADSIFLHPTGLTELKGLRSELLFFKGTLDKLGVEPQVFRHGKFKSAVEPFIQESLSDANRAQIRSYIGSIWNHMVAGIAKERKLSEAEVQDIASRILVTNAEAAVQYKLVDKMSYRDEVLELLKKKTSAEEIDKIEFVSIGKMTDVKDTRDNKGKDKIAVVFAEGDIVDGEGDAGQIGSIPFSKAIRKARLDDKVKALVLRINSPGGSALASETIWREVVLTKKVKPVIVSMGTVAASGGYYIAAPADTIIASPTTITGSIGVFGLFFNAKGLANNLGVTIDTVKTNPMADIMTGSRAVTAQEREIIQQEIERIYDNFITRVAEGRKMNKADVDSIAQGRVWSGVDAKRLGLVDMYGGLETAIEVAAKKAGLESYRIQSLPYQEDPFQKFMKELSGETEDEVMQKALGDSYKYYQQLNHLRSMKSYQARLPYEIELY